MIRENDEKVTKRIFVERVKNLKSFDTREAHKYIHVCVCGGGGYYQLFVLQISDYKERINYGRAGGITM